MSAYRVYYHKDWEESSSALYILTIVIVIVMIFITGVFIANAFFFAEIRKSGCGTKISTSEGEMLYWFNLILAIISGLIVLFAIFILVFWRSERSRYYGQRYLYDPRQYYTYQQETIPEQLEQLRQYRIKESRLKSQIRATEAAQLAAAGDY